MKEYSEGLTYEFYPVGEDGGVTKCHLHGVENNANMIIGKLVEKHSNFFYSFLTDDGRTFIGLAAKATIPNHYTGKAVVNTEMGDTYDEKTGQELAHSRCMDKYHKHLDRKIKDFLIDLLSLVVVVEHYCEERNIDMTDVPHKDELRKKIYSYAKPEES